MRLTPRALAFSGVSAVMLYLAMVPLITLFLVSLSAGYLELTPSTLENYIMVLTSPRLFPALINTLIFAFGSAAFGVIVGTLLAWSVERADLPFKGFIRAFSIIPYLIPEPVAILGWILLLSPSIGVINQALMGLLNLSAPPFNIYGLPGMIFVESLHIAPLAFLLISAAFRSLSSEFEDAARAAGANVPQTLYFVTLRLMRPAILSALLLLVVRQMGIFATPKLLGLPAKVWTVTTEIYDNVRGFTPQYGAASVYSILLLSFCTVGVLLYRRAVAQSERFITITGRGGRAGLVALGKRRYLALGMIMAYFAIAVFLPLSVVILCSLLPYYGLSWDILQKASLANYERLFTYPATLRAATNSLLLATSAPTIAVVLASIASWFSIKSRIRGGQIPETACSIIMAVPLLILGFAILLVYVRTPIYATPLVLLVAYVTMTLPTMIRYTNPGVMQIHSDLEDGAKVCGSPWLRTFTRITLPLLLPSIIAGWIQGFTIVLRDVSTAILLVHPGNEVLGVTLFDLIDMGEYASASALGVFMIAIILAIYVLTQRFGLRRH
jgi:iron(III) transport system permease protein